MEIRKLERKDIPAVLDMYVRCMSGDPYFKNLYKLRRDADKDKLSEKLFYGHGPALAGVIGHGASFGAHDGSSLIGFYVCFWYDSVRQYDPELFLDVFAGPDGLVDYGDGLHSIIATLGGAVLYGLSLCVDGEYRRKGTSTKLVDAAFTRLRPKALAAAVSAPELLPVYERRGCAKYDLGDGRILCVVRE